jgi:hypothetical protein|nr:MAG TPA: hypothetical protein [Caudoviricetes sp.]
MKPINNGQLDYKMLVERPMSAEGKLKYGTFVNQNEAEILKGADLGIIPILDRNNNNVVIGWKLNVDPEKTKVNPDHVEVIDFGPFGQLKFPLVKCTNKRITNNGKEKIETSYSLKETDTLIAVKALQAWAKLSKLMHKFLEPQTLTLSKEFRDKGNLFSDSTKSALIGYKYLEQYYGLTSSDNPNEMARYREMSDVKRFTHGNLTYYFDTKLKLYNGLLEILKNNEFSKLGMDPSSVDTLIGTEDFTVSGDTSVYDMKGGVYQGITGGINPMSQYMTTGKPMLENFIVNGGPVNNNYNNMTMQTPNVVGTTVTTPVNTGGKIPVKK